jgi:hypothetical protein
MTLSRRGGMFGVGEGLYNQVRVTKHEASKENTRITID